MITNVSLSRRITEALGLAETKLEGLQQVVILAGKNGGGKTRLLQAIRQTSSEVDSIREKLLQLERSPIDSAGSADLDEAAARKQMQDIEVLKRDADRISTSDQIRGLRAQFLDFETARIATSEAQQIPSLSQLEELGPSILSLPLFDVFALSTHLLSQYTHALRLAALKPNAPEADAADRFAAFLFGFLGLRLSPRNRDVSAIAPGVRLGSRDFDVRELSAGQKTLLAWAIHLFETQVNGGKEHYSGKIIVIDEPELHIHPEAAIKLLHHIRESLGEHGQLWVATHCPAIVAHLATGASVYHVSEGAAHYVSNNVAAVMNGLLGGDENRRVVRQALDEAELVQFYQFAVECLRIPSVADRFDDRQSNQVVTHVAGLGPALRVLDYASGRSRFARALAEGRGREEGSIDVEYFAWNDRRFDGSDVAAYRRSNIALLHGADDAPRRDSYEISDFENEARVDVVIMCNFFHEIGVEHWREHLLAVHRILKDDGYLLWMEDQDMPVGELPHAAGYLVLNLGEVRNLLGTTERVVAIPSSNERISAIRIERGALELDPDVGFAKRVRETLERIKERALEEIREIRKKANLGTEGQHRFGRQHARASLQFANAWLALTTLGAT